MSSRFWSGNVVSNERGWSTHSPLGTKGPENPFCQPWVSIPLEHSFVKSMSTGYPRLVHVVSHLYTRSHTSRPPEGLGLSPATNEDPEDSPRSSSRDSTLGFMGRDSPTSPPPVDTGSSDGRDSIDTQVGRLPAGTVLRDLNPEGWYVLDKGSRRINVINTRKSNVPLF